MIDQIIAKGIPILRKHIGQTTLIQIDAEFKALQTRENVLKLHEFVVASVAKQMQQ